MDTNIPSISKFRAGHFGLFMAFAFAVLLGGAIAGRAAAPNTPEGKTLEVSKAPVQIAKAGKALVPIVISPESSEAIKKTAEELAGYLKRITGAEFAIEQGTEAKGITLGTLAQFPDAGLKESMAIKEGYNGVEAFAIRSDDGRIRLLRNTDLGVEHAAYRFLKLQGCRWFFQGETWEIVPGRPDLAYELNETDQGPRPHQGRSEGELIPLSVKDGTDGKAWSITGKFRDLWFLDIPTVLSLSSEMIFVPTEVAVKEGLKVVL